MLLYKVKDIEEQKSKQEKLVSPPRDSDTCVQGDYASVI